MSGGEEESFRLVGKMARQAGSHSWIKTPLIEERIGLLSEERPHRWMQISGITNCPKWDI